MRSWQPFLLASLYGAGTALRTHPCNLNSPAYNGCFEVVGIRSPKQGANRRRIRLMWNAETARRFAGSLAGTRLMVHLVPYAVYACRSSDFGWLLCATSRSQRPRMPVNTPAVAMQREQFGLGGRIVSHG